MAHLICFLVPCNGNSDKIMMAYVVFVLSVRLYGKIIYELEQTLLHLHAFALCAL